MLQEGYIKGTTDELKLLNEKFKKNEPIYYAWGNGFQTTNDNMKSIVKLEILSIESKNKEENFTNERAFQENEKVRMKIISIAGDLPPKFKEEFSIGYEFESNATEVFMRTEGLKFTDNDFNSFISNDTKLQIHEGVTKVNEIL